MTRGRSVGVVTTSRADYGIFKPVIRGILESETLSLKLYVSGMHLADEFHQTVRQIEADGLPIAERVESLVASGTPQSLAKTMGLATISFAQVFSQNPPDLLMVLGDRFEMFAVALAALPFKIPVAHLHGGERSEGAIDESLRHAMSKLSHLHFTATDEYAARLVRMGEQPDRVFAVGAPALDNLTSMTLADVGELEEVLGLPLETQPPLLVTFHPESLDHEHSAAHAEALLQGLGAWAGPIVFTQSNADTGSYEVRRAIERFVAARSNARLVGSLGTRRYFGLMRVAAAMVGNSSSGIIEAASFGLPVINLGERQHGRLRAPNVLDVSHDADALAAALRAHATPAQRARFQGMTNPYGDGRATGRILSVLERLDWTAPGFVTKPFYDPVEPG